MMKHALLAVSAATLFAFASGCGCINDCVNKHSWYGDADCCGNNHCIDHRFGQYGFGACGECGAPCNDCGCNGGCPGYNQCASGCGCDECDRYECPLTYVWRFTKGIFHSPGPVGPCYDCGCGNGGCGEKYCCDWINVPPTCDPCDHCGNYCGCHDPKPCYQATPRFGGVPMAHAESAGAVDDGVMYEGKKASTAATR